MKSELDKRVAQRLGLKVDDVSAVTFEFLEVLRHALVEDGEVAIARLGALRVKEMKVDRDVELTDGPFKPQNAGRKRKVHVERNFRVFFSKSPHLKDELEKHHGKVWR